MFWDACCTPPIFIEPELIVEVEETKSPVLEEPKEEVKKNKPTTHVVLVVLYWTVIFAGTLYCVHSAWVGGVVPVLIILEEIGRQADLQADADFARELAAAPFLETIPE